jgi:hypothetical protein
MFRRVRYSATGIGIKHLEFFQSSLKVTTKQNEEKHDKPPLNNFGRAGLYDCFPDRGIGYGEELLSTRMIDSFYGASLFGGR